MSQQRQLSEEDAVENWTLGTFEDGNSHNELQKMKMVALKAKNHALEAKNQMLEMKGMLENQELRAKMRDKSLERKLQMNERKMEEITELEQKHQEEIAELKMKNGTLTEENKAFGDQLKQERQKVHKVKCKTSQSSSTQMKNGTLTEENKAFGDQLKQERQKVHKLEEDNRMGQQQMLEFGKEMAKLKEEQQKQTILFEQIKLEKLIKTKRVANTKGNRWNCSNTAAIISSDGLRAMTNKNRLHIFAVEPFPIATVAGEPCSRKDYFLDIALFYFEVTQTTASNEPLLFIGLSDGTIPDGTYISKSKNSVAMGNGNGDDCYWLNGEKHRFEWPIGAVKPEWKNGLGNVIGCGILVNREDKLSIFFTGNDKLMGKQIPIVHPNVCLYPSATMWEDESLEANFGDDLEKKPFKYDIEKCEGLVFE